VCPTITFDEALIEVGDGSKSILLGNGFSIAQAGQLFTYTNLLERSGLPVDDAVRNVFRVLDTVDFEEVIRALEHAAQIETAYNEVPRAEQFRTDSRRVREALIHAIRSVHPGIRFDIPQAQRDACANFLRRFSVIFTLNYDLLLYWVMLHMEPVVHSDGFGLGEAVNGFRTFSTDGNCSVHYLHGALHLFLNQQQETLKRIVTGNTIVDDIANTIQRRLPLFVAEGTSAQKMRRINSVPYLRHGYDKLRGLNGNLFILGHSASEADHHIYDAVFHSRIDRLFFCVHRPQENLAMAQNRLAPFMQAHRRIAVQFVDGASISVWG